MFGKEEFDSEAFSEINQEDHYKKFEILKEISPNQFIEIKKEFELYEDEEPNVK